MCLQCPKKLKTTFSAILRSTTLRNLEDGKTKEMCWELENWTKFKICKLTADLGAGMILTFAFSFPSACVTWNLINLTTTSCTLLLWYDRITISYFYLFLSTYTDTYTCIYIYIYIHLFEWHCIRYIGSCCSGHTTRRPTLMRQRRTFGPRLAESFPNAFSRALGWQRYLDWKVWHLFRRWHLVGSRFSIVENLLTYNDVIKNI